MTCVRKHFFFSKWKHTKRFSSVGEPCIYDLYYRWFVINYYFCVGTARASQNERAIGKDWDWKNRGNVKRCCILSISRKLSIFNSLKRSCSYDGTIHIITFRAKQRVYIQPQISTQTYSICLSQIFKSKKNAIKVLFAYVLCTGCISWYWFTFCSCCSRSK